MTTENQDPNPIVTALRAALAHHRAGDLDAAEAGYRAVTQAHPTIAEAWVMLGALRDEVGAHDEALEHLDRALALNPDHLEALNNKGLALIGLGRADEALIAFARALALKPDYADAMVNKGQALAALGRPDDAEAQFQRAIDTAPDDPEVWINVAKALKMMDRMAHAVDAYRRGLAAMTDPGPTPLQVVDYAVILDSAGRPRDAVAVLDQLRAAAPDYLPGLSFLACLYEETNRLDEAEALVERVRAADPADRRALLTAARLARRRGDLAEARALLRDPAWTPGSSGGFAVPRLFELGRVEDRLGDAAAAMEAFAAANAAQREALSFRAQDRDAYPTHIETTRTVFAGTDPAAWPPGPGPDPDGPSPAFLLGFPRSGTTLLEQVLGGHAGLTVLDERPALDDTFALMAQLAGADTPGPAAIPTLDAERIAALRRNYRTAAARYLGMSRDIPPWTRIVDKLPLNTVEVGLIHRLWPDAPIILALRHPCDVVLSNFMQHFRLNKAMTHFTSLSDAVALYDRVMGLWRVYEDRLPLVVMQSRYEDLVADFEGQTRALVAFLGLEWDDALMDYAERAKTTGTVITPSRDQVTEPIYTRAAGRWHKYRPWLEPHLDTLRPYIEAFGYEA